MLISHRKRFIFIHIPKTGGSSIEKALVGHGRWQERICLEYWPTRKAIAVVNRTMGWTANGYKQWTGIHKHARASVIRDAMPSGLFEQYFRFTVVRNPFDRLVSEFFYGLPVSGYKEAMPHFSDKRGLVDQFRGFVNRAVAGKVRPLTHFGMDPRTGESLVDAVVHLEAMDADFRCLQERIGLYPAHIIPRVNVSRRRPVLPLQVWYNPATIELVRDGYSDDFYRFGYSMELPNHS